MRKRFRLVLLAVGILVAGCDGMDPSEPGTDSLGDDCGPNGTRHGDHCHCDTGYREVADRCEPIEACSRTETDALETGMPGSGGPWETRWNDRERHLCPGESDHHTVKVSQGDTLVLELDSARHGSELVLTLWEPGKSPRYDTPVVRSQTGEELQTISHRARKTGLYLFEVRGTAPTIEGRFHLRISKQ